ncbi:MAG: cytochrome ubiquinol oxidase subunit I [Acidobacteriota bacterium]
MEEALILHRLHFAFTIMFHYIFVQLSMGLALMVFIFKTLGLRRNDPRYDDVARFWIKILAVSFALGVVTGVPMEFQFGTNWAQFSKAAGGVIGQTLAMEGVFAFFLESSFLGLLLFGEKKLGRRGHWWMSLLVFFGSWLSGYFIIATNAWMLHPVGYTLQANGQFSLNSFWALVFNPWILWQYTHNQLGASVTGSLVVAGIGAIYLLLGRHREHAHVFVRTGVIIGFICCVLLLFPTGDQQGRNIARYQPVTLAGMEGLFQSVEGAPLAILGQPDTVKQRLDNPLLLPNVLSFMTYRHWTAEVRGLDAFPKEDWPTNIPLLFYSFRIMVGLGTIFIVLTGLAVFLLWRGRLMNSKAMLWILAILTPFPFISNLAGWLTVETGRQPWVIYGLMRTSHGASPYVSAGNTMFTLIGFMGMYALLIILFLFLLFREFDHGPQGEASQRDEANTVSPAQ